MNTLETLAARVEGLSDKGEYPHLRKVGRYVLFAFCALGAGVLAGALTLQAGLSDNYSEAVCNIVGFAVLLTLRDMSKSWDITLRALSKQEGGR